jgi:ribose-phosphate pyrophosphokinase
VIPHITQRTVVARFRDAGAFNPKRQIVIPDAGATKRTAEWSNMFKGPFTQGYKVRSMEDGTLSGFAIDNTLVLDTPIAVVDDICDGGGTFLGLKQAIVDAGNQESISLVTTHGLYTKGIDILSKEFDLWTLDIYDNPEYNGQVKTISTKDLVAHALSRDTII